jgi:hypothetical protein
VGEAVENLADDRLIGDDVLTVRNRRVDMPVGEVPDVHVHIARTGIADRGVTRLDGIHGLEVPSLDVHCDVKVLRP